MEKLILEILKENPTLSNREIGKLIGKARTTVQYYLNKLNIHRDRKQQQKLNNTSRENMLSITDNAEQIILGSILGDGSISKHRKPSNTKETLNSQLIITHGIKQLEYLKYKKDLLESEGIKCHLKERKIYKTHYIKGIKVKENGSYILRTARNVSFNKYRNLFYSKKKYINRYIYKLNSLGLAIWYMDDGCFNKHSICLYTNGFSIKDDYLLLEVLKHNFNIEATLHKTSNIGRCIYIKAKSRKRFLELVNPHICESMKYKIGT